MVVRVVCFFARNRCVVQCFLAALSLEEVVLAGSGGEVKANSHEDLEAMAPVVFGGVRVEDIPAGVSFIGGEGKKDAQGKAKGAVRREPPA